jgi:hypothetical protein
MSSASKLLLNPDDGRLSLFSIGCIMSMGIFPRVWLSCKSRGPKP